MNCVMENRCKCLSFCNFLEFQVTQCLCLFLVWKGPEGLKACPGMTEEESKLNLELCNTVLEDPDIKTLYRIHKVEGTGRVTLEKTKGRKHISNILCYLNTPSAYQKQVR